MDKITLNNNEYRIIYKDIEQSTLYFYEKNPRIMVNRKDEKKLAQSEIYDFLVKSGNVHRLKTSIRENGGIIEPLLVRNGDNVVLEGNSRLAALRELAREDKNKWRYARCMVLLDDIKDEDFYSLISQYHIVMKEKWSNYDKAAFLSKMVERGKSVEDIAREVSISTVEIRNLLYVYRLMNETQINHEHFNKVKTTICMGLGGFIKKYDLFWNALFETKGTDFTITLSRLRRVYKAQGEEGLDEVCAHKKRLCDVEDEIKNNGGLSVYKVLNNLQDIRKVDIWSSIVRVEDDDILYNVYKKLEELKNICVTNLKKIELRTQN